MDLAISEKLTYLRMQCGSALHDITVDKAGDYVLHFEKFVIMVSPEELHVAPITSREPWVDCPFTSREEFQDAQS